MSSPHASPAPRKGRYLAVKVVMLDDTVHTFHVPQKALGQALFDGVVKKLQLLEMDYFDLEYTDMQGTQYWLDKEKPVVKQLAQSRDLTLRFLVKFYTPDPGLLEEEYTRYLYAQQIRRDLQDGMIQCQDSTAALLASFIVQSDVGDFLDEEYLDHLYLKEMKFIPNQNEEFLIRVMDYHKDHVGQTPADADFNLLETARKCELYGIRMHTAKVGAPTHDHEDVNLNLGVAHMGVLVYQGYTKINTFSWAKIRKLSFKRKKFLIKLHPEGYGYYKDTVEFYFETRNECKNFWKKCIEYHAFFRCPNVKRIPRNKTRVVSRGSSFRYCGRTQKQLVEYVRENYVKRAPFERTTSMRTVSSMRSAGATPKTGTLNSRDSRERDYPNSGLHNTSASSGSRTLDMSHENVLTAAAARVEAADVHDDSSQSGSRSLSSPKKDHRGLQSELRNHDGSEMEDDMHEHVESQHKVLPSRSPRASRIDPSKFMLTKDDRKMSAPVFSQAHPAESIEDGKYLPRSPEVENIPERVMVNSVDRFSPSLGLSPQLKRTQSAAEASPPPPYREIISPPIASSTIIEEPLPPPPPPIFYEDEDSKPIKMRITREMREEVVSRSTTSAASVTLTSSAASSKTEGSEDEELRRKRFAIDKAFYIAKEVLMTERTYKKDLEVITVWFRAAVEKEDAMPSQLMQLLFSSFNPLYEFHSSFLKDIEQRLAMWEGKANAHLNGEYRRLGDVMLNITRVLQLYSNYIDHHEDILTEVEQTWRKNKLFEQTYKDFEAQKVCYLPLNTFLLKPAQRLLHYRLVLQRLLQHYDQTHPDYHDCQEAFSRISEVTNVSQERMQYLENLQKLIELQRDIVGIDNLVLASRQFLREGCLQKLSRKGYQQRMFFLFSDMLVYTSRTGTPALQFKVHGQLPLRGMIVEETDANMAVANSFTIYGGNRCLLVAASSAQEKDKWLEDLRVAITAAKERGEEIIKYASLKSNSSSDNLEDSHDEPRSPATPEKQIQHRANTTMHVCWHRNTSVSMRDHFIATENQLSGYLLRKFKSSNGWQKLWVVFTNFCLFFYKTYQDDYPLASLPLLGYSVSTPSESDGIHKDFVFKLQFKNHVYFFRAESDYTFSRWVEVIRSATSSAHLMRLFSRTESDS